MMGEMSIEVLKSTTVSSLKIQQAGFSFRYPVIQSAIKALVAAQGEAFG
jgi:NAD dependent epimerase/dehydratase family enzyme